MKTIFRRCFPGPVTKNSEFFTIPTSPPIRKSRLPIAHTRREKRVEICTSDTPWPPHKRGLSWLLPRLGECAAPRSRGLPTLSNGSPCTPGGIAPPGVRCFVLFSLMRAKMPLLQAGAHGYLFYWHFTGGGFWSGGRNTAGWKRSCCRIPS